MPKFSNALVGALNFLSFLISFPILGVGLWFRFHAATHCERLLHLPIIVLGAFLLVVSIFGLVGSCCRVSFFMWVYLFVLFLLILATVAYTAFVLVVTNKVAGEAVSGKGYKEYRLGNYSHWLQRALADWKAWREIEACLQDAKVCGGLEGEIGLKANEFYQKNLSPLQSGCCKPPTYCGFVYQNATYWVAPATGLLAPTDKDCRAWSNDRSKLCYECDSCKAGALAVLKKGWKEIAICNAALVVFLVFVYSFGCCAYRNNRKASRYERYYR